MPVDGLSVREILDRKLPEVAEEKPKVSREGTEVGALAPGAGPTIERAEAKTTEEIAAEKGKGKKAEVEVTGEEREGEKKERRAREEEVRRMAAREQEMARVAAAREGGMVVEEGERMGEEVAGEEPMVSKKAQEPLGDITITRIETTTGVWVAVNVCDCVGERER